MGTRKIVFKTEIYPVSKNDLQKIIEKNNFKKGGKSWHVN